MSAIDKLHKEYYTKSNNKVIPREFKWVKGELFYLCQIDEYSYQEIRDKDLFQYQSQIKENKYSRKNRYKPIALEENGISKIFYNTRHFKEFENNDKIGIRQLRNMLDIEGLSSNIFEPEPELVNDWNKQHKDYQLYISPITFE